MDDKQKSVLAAAVAASLGGAGVADAASINMVLTGVTSYSSGGTLAGNISSSTATWSYDEVLQVLTQTGGTYDVRFRIAPTATLFRHSITGLITAPAGAAAASTFVCTEGSFGPSVGASICGNYNFGANFENESASSWGPGTAFARTVGGDDGALGAQQSLAAYDNFAQVSKTYVSFADFNLVLGNASCNPFAPGNANGCAASGGLNTGYRFALSSAALPVPGAVWLFGSALGLLGAARRRAKH